MFQQLILPLKENRSHCVVADFAEETATEYRKHTYQFEDVDIIALEGIYLPKWAYCHHFDLSFWVDCTFETGLERALRRGQEGLPPAETIRAYETIYFPAQRIHLKRDNPQAAADFIINNDPRLVRDRWRSSCHRRGQDGFLHHAHRRRKPPMMEKTPSREKLVQEAERHRTLLEINNAIITHLTQESAMCFSHATKNENGSRAGRPCHIFKGETGDHWQFRSTAHSRPGVQTGQSEFRTRSVCCTKPG